MTDALPYDGKGGAACNYCPAKVLLDGGYVCDETLITERPMHCAKPSNSVKIIGYPALEKRLLSQLSSLHRQE